MTTAAPTPTAVPALARPARGTAWRWTGGAALVLAGVAHLVTSADHLGHGSLVIGFFLLTAFAQLGAAVWLAAGPVHRGMPAPRVLLLGIAGLVALIGLYLVAHLTPWLGDLAGTPVGALADHAAHTSAGDPFAAGHATTFSGPVALAGATPAQPEQVTLLGTLTVAAEVLAVGALVALLPTSWRRRTSNALLTLAALVWGLWLFGVLG